jgi:hypothetical protein
MMVFIYSIFIIISWNFYTSVYNTYLFFHVVFFNYWNPEFSITIIWNPYLISQSGSDASFVSSDCTFFLLFCLSCNLDIYNIYLDIIYWVIKPFLVYSNCYNINIID